MYSCTHWLRPCTPPPAFGLILYARALLVSQDRRHLFVNQRNGRNLMSLRMSCTKVLAKLYVRPLKTYENRAGQIKYYLVFKIDIPILYVSYRAFICKPFKEPSNRFSAWRNRFLGSLKVYKFGLWTEFGPFASVSLHAKKTKFCFNLQP